MKKTKLTKREKQAMDILWSTDKALAATDIKAASEDDVSIYTVQQVLHRLKQMKLIKVTEFAQNKKVLLRKYRPAVTQFQFYNAEFSKETKYSFAVNAIKSAKSLDELEELSAMIEARKQELQGNSL